MKTLNGSKWYLKVATVIFCSIFAIFGLMGCSSNKDTTSSDSGAQEKTKLTVGFDASYPPYGFIGDDGNYTGFDLDLAKQVCDKLGWDLDLQAIDWDAKDALLDQGNINCIWNGFTMEGREGKYAFSDPYMINKQVIVVKADSGILDVTDLKDKVVITQADSAALEVLEDSQKELKDTFSRLDTIGDYNNAFMQLETGAVDAVACDLSIASYQMSANPGKYVQLADALSTENYAVGFKNDDEGKKLAKEVSETLLKLYNDGTVKTLCEKYESYGLSFENWNLK